MGANLVCSSVRYMRDLEFREDLVCRLTLGTSPGCRYHTYTCEGHDPCESLSEGSCPVGEYKRTLSLRHNVILALNP